MKAKIILLFFIAVAALLFSSCSDSDNGGKQDVEESDEIYTNKWIFERMRALYLWNDKLPTKTNYDYPTESFFYGLLYKWRDREGDRFSWIEEDDSNKTKTLYAKVDLGFDYYPFSYFPDENTQNSSLGFFVTSVNKGSDAEAKGVRRGQIIYKVNNVDVNYDNYLAILNDLSSFTLSVYNNETGKKETLPLMQANGKKISPVAISKVIESSAGKIGYILYNNFDRGVDDEGSTFEYDIELMESIRALGDVKEFILDLRYNPGGYLTSAINLASALVPNRDTKKLFIKEEYNSYFQDSIIKRWGPDAVNSYFLDKAYETNVDIPRLNLSRLHIIASENTASASEVIINGLEPYMKINILGQTTKGKDKASMTVKANDERIKYKLQPLISRLSNSKGEGNYIYGYKPTQGYEFSELEELFYTVYADSYDEYGKPITVKCPVLDRWKAPIPSLGDASEPLLAATIARIIHLPRKKSEEAVGRKSVLVPRIKQDESRFRTIVDQDRFIK